MLWEIYTVDIGGLPATLSRLYFVLDQSVAARAVRQCETCTALYACREKQRGSARRREAQRINVMASGIITLGSEVGKLMGPGGTSESLGGIFIPLKIRRTKKRREEGLFLGNLEKSGKSG